MGHHSLNAGTVTANALMDIIRISTTDFVYPIGIGNQLATHCSTVNSTGRELCLDEIGGREAPDTANGRRGIFAHLVAIFQKTSLAAKIGMAARWNDIGKIGVIGKRNMKAGHASRFQKGNNGSKIFKQHSGVSVMRIFLTDRELIVDR